MINVFLIISCMIMIVTMGYGLRKGFVKIVAPFLSGILSLILMLLLKNWAFSYMFQWKFLSGEHELARIVVVLVVFVAGSVLFNWLVIALHLLTQLPLVHGLNRLLGLFAGAIEGIMLVWLLMFIVYQFPEIELFQKAYLQIQENSQLLYLYDHNFVKIVIGYLIEIKV